MARLLEFSRANGQRTILHVDIGQPRWRFHQATLMWMAWMACCPVSRAELCLPNGMPEYQRINISDTQQDFIRFGSGTNQRSQVFFNIAHILISEVLGYHVANKPTFIRDNREAIWRLAGCSNMDCNGTQEPIDVMAHIVGMERLVPLLEEFQQRHPRVAPESLGSMGDDSQRGISVIKSIREAAFSDSGLVLEHYRSYSDPSREPHKYFDKVWDLPEALLHKCTDRLMFEGYANPFQDSQVMENYLRWTGDSEGVIQQDGETLANCSKAYPSYWMAPACRNNYTRCIPVVAGPLFPEQPMHWATAHNLPWAVTYNKDFKLSNLVELVRGWRVAYLFTDPAPTFADLHPSLIILPRHDEEGWAAGDFRTGTSSTSAFKLISRRIGVESPKVKRFMQRFKFNRALVLHILDALAGRVGGEPTEWQIACDWVRANSGVWEDWIPVATECTAGLGLSDGKGSFQASRDSAVDCQLCTSGRFSKLIDDNLGITYVCQECEPGTHQSGYGESACVECQPGTVAAQPGEALCSPCPFGSYANLSGMMSCSSCGPEVWTTSRAVNTGVQERWLEIVGASSARDCHCMAGHYLSPSGQCEICIEGSSCPGGGLLEVLPGFYSTENDPGSIWQCFGNALRCPGGAPETCAIGRDPSSVACSSCLPGLQASGAECVPCHGADYVTLALLPLLVLVISGAGHIILAMQSRATGSQFGALLTAALCLNQLVTTAQLFSVMEQVQGIVWEEPFVNFLKVFRVLSLDALLGSVDVFGCVARIGPETTFVLRAFGVPLFVATGPFVAHVAIRKQRSCQTSVLLKTLGFLILLFYIYLCSVFLEPFRCTLHPNGLRTLQVDDGLRCNVSGSHLTLCLMSGTFCILPISFLTLCCWIVLQLPRRVKAAEAAFVRACSFLILRFKPGYEMFTIAFLLRNLLFVVTPMMPSTASLFVMGVLLMLGMVSVAYFKPWRSLLATKVDLLMHAVLLMILLLGALTVPHTNVSEVMILCTVCASMVIVAATVAALYTLLQHVRSKFKKKFAFFLCHHKAAASGFARLLKMELKSRGSQFTAFIDSDNLTDLAQLFSFVANDTETLVLIGTEGVLKRKWCIGEVVTARSVQIETVMLCFPGFQLPEETVIKDYKTLVPNIVDLVAYGIGLLDIQDTLRWLYEVKKVEIGSNFSMQQFTDVVNQLSNTSATVRVPKRAGCTILADPDNTEAMATATVLALYMVKIIPEQGCPTVLTSAEDITPEDVRIILLCTQQCLQSQHISRWLLQARFVNQCKILPVVADDTFQIPKQVRGEADQLVYRQVLVAIFLEVARPFIPSHSSDIDLGIRCREVASRLHADLQPLRAKMMLVKMPSDSDTESSSSNASLALWNRTIAQDLLHRADEMVQILASETVSQAF